MLTRIELHNFMSHAETVIEPAAGLTVLVGPNNVGKSAIVAALKILCRNENSTYVMRHGERECSVVLGTDDGHRVEWRRKNSPSYVIDGQKFDRLKQGGLPDELHRALRLPTVDSGNDDDFDVHFGTQKSPIFLLNGSAATAARFFASSSDAIRLVEIQRRHKDKQSEAQREKNRLEAESKSLHAELETLEPIVDVDDRLRAAEHDYEQLEQASARLQDATRTATALAELAKLRTRHQTRADVLTSLAAPPTLADPAPLTKLIAGIEQARRAAEAAKRRAAALADLSSPPTLEPIDELAGLRTSLEKGRHAQQSATAVAEALAKIPTPPVLDDPAPLARLVQRLARGVQAVERGGAEAQRLAQLTNPPRVDDAAALRQHIDRRLVAERGLQQIAQRHAALLALAAPAAPADIQAFDQFVTRFAAAARKAGEELRAVQEIAEDLATAELDLRTVAAQSTCALCGSPLDPDRVLARAAGGIAGGHDHA